MQSMQEKEVSFSISLGNFREALANFCPRLKCDRNQPCGTCTRRGLSLSCTYVASILVTSTSLGAREKAPATILSQPTNIPDRIGQLEQLVTSLVSSGDTPKPSDQSRIEPLNGQGNEIQSFDRQPESESDLLPRDPAPPSESFGRISLQTTETSYADNTHWTSVLDGVSSLTPLSLL
jgi:hypothetical protein